MFDLVLIDLGLPDEDGPEIVTLVAAAQNNGIIRAVLSGNDDLGVAEECGRRGAAFIHKDDWTRNNPTVLSVLGLAERHARLESEKRRQAGEIRDTIKRHRGSHGPARRVASVDGGGGDDSVLADPSAVGVPR